jgi:hypothetical protein
MVGLILQVLEMRDKEAKGKELVLKTSIDLWE